MEFVYHEDLPTKQGVLEAAEQTLAQIIDLPVGGNVEAEASSPSTFVSGLPLPVYSLGLEDLIAEGLGRAKLLSYRVFVVDRQDDAIGVAECVPAAGGNPARFLGYSKGMRVEASGKALTDAAADQVTPGRFEPRFLEIPGIYTTALWLENRGGGEDRIIPIKPIPRFLGDLASFSPEEFLERVLPQAKKRLRFDDQPGEDGPNHLADADDPLAGEAGVQ